MFLMSAFVILAFDILFLTFSFWHSLFGILYYLSILLVVAFDAGV